MQKPGIVRYRRGGAGERHDGIAQVGAGEIARVAVADDILSQRRLGWAAQDPNSKAVGQQLLRQRRI